MGIGWPCLGIKSCACCQQLISLGAGWPSVVSYPTSCGLSSFSRAAWARGWALWTCTSQASAWGILANIELAKGNPNASLIQGVEKQTLPLDGNCCKGALCRDTATGRERICGQFNNQLPFQRQSCAVQCFQLCNVRLPSLLIFFTLA